MRALRFRAALLAALLAVAASLGAIAAAAGASFIPDDCGRTPCTCFIQRGDEGGCVRGVIERLIERGDLDAKAVTSIFTEDAAAAVERFQADNGLPVTGTLDDDTLTLLIWGMLPEALDEMMPVDGRRPETFPDMVYVPTDGGKKRHADASCCGMLDPRKVSIRNAAKLGFDACKRCEAAREARLH